jgi:dihydropteroate synthase
MTDYNTSKLYSQKYKIMGILNVTPDSFFDGGKYDKSDVMSERIRQIIAEGADIIDIGGESTRPDAETIDATTEIERITPAIQAVRKISKDILISIDTSKPEVAEKALKLGANIVNDITGLRDRDMMKVVKRFNVPIIIMHMRGTPKDMQKQTDYKDILKEIADFFSEKIDMCIANGISAENIVVDPGIGFAKTREQCLYLLKHLDYFKRSDVPLLVGTSRKSFIGKTLDREVEDRLYASLATIVYAYVKGATIFRVHDVKPSKDVLEITNAIGFA